MVESNCPRCCHAGSVRRRTSTLTKVKPNFLIKGYSGLAVESERTQFGKSNGYVGVSPLAWS